jgi:hypothetical protein
MHIVEAKHIREILLFRIKSLNACGMPEIAAIIHNDLAEIMQNEKTMVMNEHKTDQLDRMWRIKNAN